jgi:transposase InsO family protein
MPGDALLQLTYTFERSIDRSVLAFPELDAAGVERTYHRRRRQRPLGKLTPIEFEAAHEVVHAT